MVAQREHAQELLGGGRSIWLHLDVLRLRLRRRAARHSLFCAFRASPALAGLAIFSLGASPHEVPSWGDVCSVGAWLCGEDAASS